MQYPGLGFDLRACVELERTPRVRRGNRRAPRRRQSPRGPADVLSVRSVSEELEPGTSMAPAYRKKVQQGVACSWGAGAACELRRMQASPRSSGEARSRSIVGQHTALAEQASKEAGEEFHPVAAESSVPGNPSVQTVPRPRGRPPGQTRSHRSPQRCRRIACEYTILLARSCEPQYSRSSAQRPILEAFLRPLHASLYSGVDELPTGALR